MKTVVAICAISAALALANTEESPSVLKAERSEEKGKGKGRGKGMDSSSSDDEFCKDPGEVVLDLLACFTDEDTACVTAAYHPDFEIYHNEILSQQDFEVTSEDFWGVTFLILDLSFEIKFSNSPGPNQALVRYIETVIVSDGHDFGLAVSTDYPFGYTFLQHEDALVTVDNDCKLVKWDQYGDNKEQTDVDDAVAALICAIGPDDCPS